MTTQAHTPSPRVDPSHLADRLRPLLLQLSRQLRREALKSGLSPLDSQLLMALKQAPGIGVSELARAEHMSRPTMSVHVKRLEAAGWIARRAPDQAPDQAKDKRRVQLVLSEEGATMLAAVRRSRTDWLVRRLARMAPEELAALDGGIAPLARLIGA